MNRKYLEELGLEKDAIDKVMAEHGKTIQSVKPDDYDDLKNDNATLKQQLNDLQTTLDNHQKELNSVEDLKKQVETANLNNLKISIAHKANIPFEFADRLNGTTEEEIKADAEKIAGFVNKTQPLPLKPTEPPVNDKDAGLKKMLENMNK